MRLRQTAIYLQGFFGQSFRFWKCLLERMIAVPAEHGIAVGQTRISQGVSWIEIDCLSEVREALLYSRRCSFVPEVTRFQISSKCLRTICGSLRQQLSLCTAQIPDQRFC